MIFNFWSFYLIFLMKKKGIQLKGKSVIYFEDISFLVGGEGSHSKPYVCS